MKKIKPGERRTGIGFSSDGNIGVPQYLCGFYFRITLQNIEGQTLDGFDLFDVERWKSEYTLVCRCLVDDLYSDRRVVQACATAPGTHAGMPGPIPLIHQVEDSLTGKTCTDVGRVSGVRNEIMRTD
ncbi:hypothetical protein D3C80_1728080 [compost metagenome]